LGGCCADAALQSDVNKTAVQNNRATANITSILSLRNEDVRLL